MTKELPCSRASYEGAGGWKDGRLGQAYDLIDAVLTERRNPETDLDQMLTAARDAVENADVEIGKIR